MEWAFSPWSLRALAGELGIDREGTKEQKWPELSGSKIRQIQQPTLTLPSDGRGDRVGDGHRLTENASVGPLLDAP